MATFAQIRGGVVAEIIVLGDDITPGVDVYTPEFAAELKPCAADVQQGWRFEGGTFSPPAGPTIDLLGYVADKRGRVENGGITIAGVPVATDDRSKIMIMGSRIAASANPEWSAVWQGADGEDYPITAAAMIEISDAVQAHINAVFATYATIKALIAAGTITSTAQIDEAFA